MEISFDTSCAIICPLYSLYHGDWPDDGGLVDSYRNAETVAIECPDLKLVKMGQAICKGFEEYSVKSGLVKRGRCHMDLVPPQISVKDDPGITHDNLPIR